MTMYDYFRAQLGDARAAREATIEAMAQDIRNLFEAAVAEIQAPREAMQLTTEDGTRALETADLVPDAANMVFFSFTLSVEDGGESASVFLLKMSGTLGNALAVRVDDQLLEHDANRFNSPEALAAVVGGFSKLVERAAAARALPR